MNCLHWLGLGLSLATASYAQVIVNAGALRSRGQWRPTP